MTKLITSFLVCLVISRITCQNTSRRFPDDFKFGVATSAYQVEGGWNADGKGESNWDHFTHTRPDAIEDGSNGDVSADSYHLYKEDIKILKDLGVDFYRFSIAWTRILPTGYANYINPKGIAFYNNLINELLNNNITPIVTIYHWDTPKKFEDLGSWTNPIMINYFSDYARVLFDNFGDRVKYWVTFNEIQQICHDPYGTLNLFNINNTLSLSGLADYHCTRTTLLAHAKVYHLYDQVYRSTQKGQIGMTTQSNWYEPKSNKTEDLEAAERAMLFHFGLFTDPIHSKTGDFPEVVKTYVAKKSKEQGYPYSRLPSFTTEEVNYIKGTADFLGLNYYTARFYSDSNGETSYLKPSYEDDCDGEATVEPTWNRAKSEWLYVVPQGLRKFLNWLTKRYNAPQILILENGFSDGGQMNDSDRIFYYRSHLEQVLAAIYDDGCHVTHYTAWTLLDCFEWFDGYATHFGLYSVDFKHQNKTRTAKGSAVVYKEIVRSRVIDWNFDPQVANITGNSNDINVSSRTLILILAITLYFIHYKIIA